ncbi:MAG: PorT family protein [Bacteroidales bacterium]|nr:PorT family protein [Bacteroidales bacterium]
MKNTVAILFIVLASNVNAQELWLGVKATPQFSWLGVTGNSAAAKGSQTGLDFGLVVEKYYNANYAFKTGISISTNGGTVAYNDTVTLGFNNGLYTLLPAQEVNYKIQYVNVPVSMLLKSNPLGSVAIYAEMGIKAMLRAKASAKTETPDNLSKTQDAKEEIKPFNIAYFVGTGVEASLGGNTSARFGIGYANGFLDLSKNEKDNLSLNIMSVQLELMF